MIVIMHDRFLFSFRMIFLHDFCISDKYDIKHNYKLPFLLNDLAFKKIAIGTDNRGKLSKGWRDDNNIMAMINKPT